MWLRHISVLNWANLPNKIYELPQTALVTGGTGVGKTTLLDAVQTLMTAGHQDLCSFNPGQDESSQKSRTKTSRTLASYVLGCDDGLYARPHSAYTYIIGRFVPSTGEPGSAFTALIGVSAKRIQESGEGVPKVMSNLYLVLRDVDISLGDVTREHGGAQKAVPVDEIVQHLRLIHPEMRIEPAVSKAEYLQMLYGALSGRKQISKERAFTAAKQFARFMVYKPIKHLDTFVREEILEPDDLRQQLEDVSELMRSIQRMKEEAERIEEGVGFLEKAGQASGNIIETLADQALASFEDASRKVHSIGKKLEAAKAHGQTLKVQQSDCAAERQRLQREVGRIGEQINALNQQISGSDAVRQKNSLEAEIKAYESQRSNGVRRLLGENHARARNYDLLTPILRDLKSSDIWRPDEDEPNWRALMKDALNQDSWSELHLAGLIEGGRFDSLLDQEATARAIDERYNRVVGALESRREAIGERYHVKQGERRGLGNLVEDLSKAIREIETSGQVTYPHSTRAALALLRESMPECNPRVICDHIEVIDNDWQVAIEGLFGNSRFDIVVDAQYESRAIGLVNRYRQKIGRTGVIQGERARRNLERKGEPSDPASITHLMGFTDETVRAFVLSKFGGFRQVLDNESLRHERMGLTSEGNASSSFRMYVARVEEADLVFGQSARERSLEFKHRDLALLEQQADRLDHELRVHEHWQTAGMDAKRINLAGELAELLTAQMEIQQRQKTIDALDLSGAEEVLKKIKKLEEDHSRLDREKTEAGEFYGSLKTEIETNEKNRRTVGDSLQEARAERERAQKSTVALQRINPQGYPWEDRLSQIKQALDDETPAIIRHSQQRLGQAYAHLSGAVTEFNAKTLHGISIPMDSGIGDEDVERGFESMTHLHGHVQTVLNRLRDNILAANRRSLDETSRRFNETFICDVCLKMRSCINRGRETLENLNHQLRRQRFGPEYYQFSWEWRREYKEYADFFESAARLQPDSENLSLLDNEEFSKRDLEIFEELRRLLLQQDHDRAMRELGKLTDYREYRNYDIYKHYDGSDRKPISLKIYGTGSGGQLETPSYVVRSAALASALGWSEGETHLRFVMIDESFSKLDTQRCKEVMDYLTRTLDLQLLFVIPDKSSGPLHDAVDMLIDVSKVRAQRRIGELDTQVFLQTTVMNRERVEALVRRETAAAETRAAQSLDFLDGLDEEKRTGTDGPA